MSLDQITVATFREYQAERSSTCGANKINQELATLIRILKRARCWTRDLEEDYEPLQGEEADVPRAMSPEQQQHFLNVAASRQEWQFVHFYSVLALQTTASNCEMRGLQIADLNLYSGIMQVRRENAKNKYRIRTIPLYDDARWAAARLIERANSLGAVASHHYVMPFRISRIEWNPTRPMSNSGMRKPWDEIRRAAEVPWLRIHDLRHTAITRMAEAGVPSAVILSMAGHISQRMQQHYTAVSEQAKRVAVEAAFKRGKYDVVGGRLLPQDAAPKRSVVKMARKAKQSAAPETNSEDENVICMD
jgi:integrase